MRIDRHIFGSYSGYTTLARSAGVSADDARTLESGAYAFGQSNDRSYLKSLGKQPAYFTRLLAGGRRGLTRVLEGDPDDNNRPTLRLITLIISQREWDTLLCGDINLLLEEKSLWQWDGQPSLPTAEYTPGAPSRAIARKGVDKLLALVSEAEKALANRRALVVSADDYALADLRALEMLIPPASRRQFTTACRGLSPQLPVNVNCLAAEAGSQGRATFRYSAGANHLSPYATFLANTELASGAIPIEQIAGYRQFGVSEAAAPPIPTDAVMAKARNAAPALAPRQRRGSPWPVLIMLLLALCLSAGTFFAGKSIATSETLAAERTHQETQRQEHEKATADAVAAQAANDRESLKKKLELSGNSWDDLLTAASSRLQSASNATTAAHDSASDRDSLKGEHEQFKTAYESELGRQRARFESLKKEAAAALGVKDARKIDETSRDLSRIDGELAALSEDWPAAKEENRKWVVEVKALRQRIQIALNLGSQISHILALLDDCERKMGTSGIAAADVIKSNAEEASDWLGQLPAKPDSGSMDLKEFRVVCGARIAAVNKWLAVQQKGGPKPAAPEAQTAGDELGKWWNNLPPQRKDWVRKRVQEWDAKKRQQEKQQAGGQHPERQPQNVPPNGPPRERPPGGSGFDSKPSPRSDNQ